MYKHENRWCDNCQQNVVVKVKKPNHVLHAVLSVVTLGIWLIIWAIAALEAVGAPKPRCPKCLKKLS